MKDYFYFYKPWNYKCKRLNGGYALVSLVRVNANKTQMNARQGFIFIALMKKKYNLLHKRRGHESRGIY